MLCVIFPGLLLVGLSVGDYWSGVRYPLFKSICSFLASSKYLSFFVSSVGMNPSAAVSTRLLLAQAPGRGWSTLHVGEGAVHRVGQHATVLELNSRVRIVDNPPDRTYSFYKHVGAFGRSIRGYDKTRVIMSWNHHWAHRFILMVTTSTNCIPGSTLGRAGRTCKRTKLLYALLKIVYIVLYPVPI